MRSTFTRQRIRHGIRHTAARAGRRSCPCIANGRLRYRLMAVACVHGLQHCSRESLALILKHVVVCLCLLVAVACGGDNKNPIAPTPMPTPTPTPTPVSGPDLVVTEFSASDSNPAPNTPFTLALAVRNDGDGAAAATTLRYYQSTDATITTADTVVGTAAVAGLVAGGKQ